MTFLQQNVGKYTKISMSSVSLLTAGLPGKTLAGPGTFSFVPDRMSDIKLPVKHTSFYKAMTQYISIVKGYHKYGVYLFGKIKHMLTHHIKTTFRFWFGATWYCALMMSRKATLCDVIWRHCSGLLCEQTERREKFRFTTECIDIAEIS